MVWTRDDVAPLTTSSQAGSDVAYTVARDGENGQALLVFDPADGHTVNSYPLPEATGWPVGVSIGHDRRVVTATSDGQVYGFAPAPIRPGLEASIGASAAARHRRLDRARGFGEHLALAEEEDHRIVGQREVLIVGRVQALARRDRIDHALLLLQVRLTSG